MNYFIKRDEKEYGPYSLADLQKYVGTGNILLTDLCRSEGLTDWVPVSQVIGNIPVPTPAPQPAAAPNYGGQARYADIRLRAHGYSTLHSHIATHALKA